MHRPDPLLFSIIRRSKGVGVVFFSIYGLFKDIYVTGKGRDFYDDRERERLEKVGSERIVFERG